MLNSKVPSLFLLPKTFYLANNMESPIESYKAAKNKDKLRKEAYNMFEEKYVVSPFTEYDFLESDERFLANKVKFFIPGRIYTYAYDPIYKDLLCYYDKRPLVLVHGQFISSKGRAIVQGVNLNFLPEVARVQALEIFFKNFTQDIASAEKAIDRGQLGVFKNVWKVLTDWMSTIKIFEVQGDICYRYAYRNYALDRIKQPVLIELEDWSTLIPYIQPKEFNGKSPQEIYSDYGIAKQKMSGKKLPDPKKSAAAQKRFKPAGQ